MRKENIEDIEKMDFKELRKTVRLLYDEVAVFKRNYADAINNLDSDNFGKSFTAEQNDMKTRIKIAADGLKSAVSKTDLEAELIGYSTLIEQLANEISLVVTSSDGESVINTASIVAAITDDKSAIKMIADEVDITGFVTFSDLGTEGATIINGANIATGTIRTNVLATNDSGYIEFDTTVGAPGIFGVDVILFSNGGYIYCDTNGDIGFDKML